MRVIFSVILLLIFANSKAQILNSTYGEPQQKSQIVVSKIDTVVVHEILGYVEEKETNQPLSDVQAILVDEQDRHYLVYSDENGYFKFNDVPIGRYTLKVSHLGHNSMSKSVVVTSLRAAEVYFGLDISLLQLSEVSVVAAPYEELSTETDLDPNVLTKLPGRPEFVRKVTVISGVQSADDSRNDVIVRGNSPQSVIWRIEGINIPNPNHFNIPGTSGGPVSIISDKVLAPSQFHSGAFKAEFGNSTSGIFDLRLKNGDPTAHIGSFQLGVLGAELTAEGPISREKKSSYSVNLRRSVLELTNAFNLDLGTPATPVYSDLTFKLNFPVKDSANLWLFGIGGNSDVDVIIDPEKKSKNIYGEKDRNQYFHSSMAVFGVGYKTKLRNGGFLYSSIAYAHEKTSSFHDLAYYNVDLDTLIKQTGNTRVFHYNYGDDRLSGYLNYSKKLNVRDTSLSKPKYIFTTGITYDVFFMHHLDSIRNITVPIEDVTNYGKWTTRLDDQESAILLQPFGQLKYVNKNFSLTTGLHLQYYSISKSKSLEPRISFAYYINNKSRITTSYGGQSQKHQPYIYFYGSTLDSKGKPIPNNKNIDFTRSRQITAAYERKLGPDSSQWRMKIESYYQYLYNVPIDRDTKSSFSIINTGADFNRVYPQPLVNKGIGKNYGIEMTIEKSFSKNYLVLLTSSLFDSKYKGSDGILRNTDFNARYIVNALVSHEWLLKRKQLVTLGLRFTTTGGKLYGPYDKQESLLQRDVVYYDDHKNSMRFPAYYRLDFRAVFRNNGEKVNHEISIDFLNILNIKNVLKNSYFPDYETQQGYIAKEYQLGFLPFIYYRLQINFSKRK